MEWLRSYYLPGNRSAPQPEHRAGGSTAHEVEEHTFWPFHISPLAGGAPVEEPPQSQFWKLFRFSHLTTTDPISSAYILIFSAPYSYLTKKKVQNLPLFASSYSYKRLEKVTSLIVTQWRSCFFTQKHPNVAMWNPSSPFCALLWRYLYKGRQNICL